MQELHRLRGNAKRDDDDEGILVRVEFLAASLPSRKKNGAERRLLQVKVPKSC
jgi:hypothetical protein